jgi:hypothetical protein
MPRPYPVSSTSISPKATSGMWFRLYTLNALSTRRLRKRAITAIVLTGLVIIGIALVYAPAVPR